MLTLERLLISGRWKGIGAAETLAEAKEACITDAKGMNRIGKYRAVHEAGVTMGVNVYRVGPDFFALTDTPDEGPLHPRIEAKIEAMYAEARAYD